MSIDSILAWSLDALRITVVPDVPRYQLPEEVLPGIPWPPGFREEFNAWARRACGTTNLLDDGDQWLLMGNELAVNPRTMAAIRAAASVGKPGGPTDIRVQEWPRL